jgi:hypothetical protein
MKSIIILVIILLVSTSIHAADICDQPFIDTGALTRVNRDPTKGNICGPYSIGGKSVCGCVITPAVGTPFFPPRRSSEPFITASYRKTSEPNTIGIEFWPDFTDKPRNFCEEISSMSEAASISTEYYNSLPAVDVKATAAAAGEVIPPDAFYQLLGELSADGKYFYLGNTNQTVGSPGGDGGMVTHSIWKVQDGVDLGWECKHYLRGFTNISWGWGAETGYIRKVFTPSTAGLELTLNLEPRVTDTGETVITLDDVKLLISRNFTFGLSVFGGLIADMDVSVVYSGGAWVPNYLMYMWGNSTPPFCQFNWVRAKILLSDLKNCQPYSSPNFASCKTLVLYTWYPRGLCQCIPTNPMAMEGGKYVTFHRDGCDNETTGEWNSIYHVMKNPFEPENAAILAGCDQSGDKDGFKEPIDCSYMFDNIVDDGTAHKLEGVAYTTNGIDFAERCPSITCCDTPGFDCSYCVTLGGYEYECGPDDDTNEIGRNVPTSTTQNGKIYTHMLEFSKNNGVWGLGKFWEASWRVGLSEGKFVNYSGYPVNTPLFVNRFLPTDKDPWNPWHFNSGNTLQPDKDFDGYLDSVDNCECIYNPDQTDTNSDGKGDACSKCTVHADCDDRNPLTIDLCNELTGSCVHNSISGPSSPNKLVIINLQ